MDWQLIGVAVLILAALAYIARAIVCTFAGSRSCGSGGCGKGCTTTTPPAPRLVSESELTARLRSR